MRQAEQNYGSEEELTPTDYDLDEPFVVEKDIAGVTVRLEVTEVTVPAGLDGEIALSENPVTVVDEVAFQDIARATEYAVRANGDLVIDGGEEASVHFLLGTLMEEVGTVRFVKEELLDAGLDVGMSLDEMAQESEASVVQLYRNTDIQDAELMAKSISFNATKENIEGADVPNSAEIRDWVDETRQQLEAALEAIEDIDTLARKAIGDAYENPVREVEDNSASDGRRTTDIEEIREMIYDSEYVDAASFVEREEALSSGETLEINTGSYINELVLRDEDGSERTLFSSQSPAQTLVEFNKEINQRE